MIVILKPCRKEIEAFPEEIRGDLADALARLDAGLMLSLPLSRPMPAIGWCTPWALAARSTCSMLSRRPRRRHQPGTWSWRERG